MHAAYATIKDILALIGAGCVLSTLIIGLRVAVSLLRKD